MKFKKCKKIKCSRPNIEGVKNILIFFGMAIGLQVFPDKFEYESMKRTWIDKLIMSELINLPEWKIIITRKLLENLARVTQSKSKTQ